MQWALKYAGPNETGDCLAPLRLYQRVEMGHLCRGRTIVRKWALKAGGNYA